MAPRSDAPELAVDELRRKARRRLVGAIVLALAAAVLLPLLLENEPKPLGDDVSIQIPPVDSGKFVNPLSPAAPAEKYAKGTTAGGEVAPAPSAPSGVGNPAGSDASTPSSAEIPPPPPDKSAPASAPASEAPKAISETKAGPAAEASPAPAASEAKPQAKPQVKPAGGQSASDSAKMSGAFVVQVAAFSDRYGAQSLVTKLKKVGFPAFTETVTTDKGTLHRVRIGPYSSREVADAARAKLKAAGFVGVVARNA